MNEIDMAKEIAQKQQTMWDSLRGQNYLNRVRHRLGNLFSSVVINLRESEILPIGVSFDSATDPNSPFYSQIEKFIPLLQASDLLDSPTRELKRTYNASNRRMMYLLDQMVVYKLTPEILTELDNV